MDSERRLVIVLYVNQKLFASGCVSRRPFFGNFAVFMEIVDLMKRENHKFSCKKKREMTLAFFMISVIVKEKEKLIHIRISFKKVKKLEINELLI
jgi:hypothetical protein